MNAQSDEEQEAQINTLYRAKDICFLNNLKTVQYTSITEQFKMAQLALAEERKFLMYIGSDEWPSEMNTIQNNLL